MKRRLGHRTNSGFPEFDKRETDGWKRAILFRGSTRNVDWIGVHMSCLSGGHAPEPVVRHQEEEIVILLKGEIVMGLCDDDDSKAITREEALYPGRIVYHPANRYHYLENRTDEPAIYIAVKWRADTRPDTPDGTIGKSAVHNFGPASRVNDTALLEQPTRWLNRLRMHTSCLNPGQGYSSHADKHDVCIVVLDGEVVSNGRTYPAGSCLFHPGGWKHGLRNASDKAAQYLVIELEGKPVKRQLSDLRELTRDAMARTMANLGAS
jgi:uncharacterized cupin superfamily protein